MSPLLLLLGAGVLFAMLGSSKNPPEPNRNPLKIPVEPSGSGRSSEKIGSWPVENAFVRNSSGRLIVTDALLRPLLAKLAEALITTPPTAAEAHSDMLPFTFDFARRSGNEAGRSMLNAMLAKLPTMTNANMIITTDPDVPPRVIFVHAHREFVDHWTKGEAPRFALVQGVDRAA